MANEVLKSLEPFVEKALKLGADEVELFGQRIRNKSVNFEANTLKSATGSILEGVGIRVLIKKALGFAGVNSLDAERIQKGIEVAVSIAKTTPSLDYYTLPDPQSVSKVAGLYDSAIEKLTMDDVLGYSQNLLDSSKAFDERISIDAGSFEVSTRETAIVSSTGIESFDLRSSLYWFIFGMAIDGDDIGSFDYEYDSVVRIKDVDIDGTAKKYAEKVLRNLGAEKTESFEGPAIITPDAMAELLSIVLTAASATQIQSGSSYLADRLGEEIAVPNLTIVDDGTLEGLTGSSSFDREGVPHQRHPIIEKGVFKGILYDTFAANREGLSSTGHASGDFRKSPTISTTNIDIAPGERSLDDIISDVDHGLLIPRVSAFPDPVSGIFTGPVKGGQLIKNGEIVCTLKEISITGNLFEGLKNIVALSKERKAIRDQDNSALIPYFKIKGMKYAA